MLDLSSYPKYTITLTPSPENDLKRGPCVLVTIQYNEQMNALLRSIPGSVFLPQYKSWEIRQPMVKVFVSNVMKHKAKLEIDPDWCIDPSLINRVEMKADLKNLNWKTRPYNYQLEAIEYGVRNKRFILGDEQGCLSGDTKVWIKRGKLTTQVSLAKLYLDSQKDKHYLEGLRIKCLVNNNFAFRPIDKIVYSGSKPVINITFSNGQSLKLTEDHKILTLDGWVSANMIEQEWAFAFDDKNSSAIIPDGYRYFIDASDDSAKKNSYMYESIGDIRSYYIPRLVTVWQKLSCPAEDVFDIKLADGTIHNFVANDIVVHNCGKTLELIYLAQYLKRFEGLKRALIICGVNGNKYNWLAEVEKHSSYNGRILGSKIGKRSGKLQLGSTNDVMAELRSLPDNVTFLITNVETLRGMHVKRKRGQRRTINEFPIVAQLQHLINSGEIGLVAFDEIHKCKSASSLQSQALMWLDCPRQVGMTGTLIMNSPLDLYVPFKWMGWESRDYWSFMNRYAIKDMWNAIIGYQNAQELINVLTCYQLRRLRKNVLELPPKVSHEEYVELSPEEWRVYKAVQYGLFGVISGEQTSDSKDLKKGLFESTQFGLDPMTLSLRLRQATASTEIVSDSIKKSSKLDRMMELVEDVVNSDGKVIIFSNWTTVTDLIMDRLRAVNGNIYRPACITGQVKQDIRNEERIRFQEDPTCKVMVGTIPALGTGFTLTAANTVIFMDEPWTKAAKDQAEDRAYRAGTVHPVDIYTLIAKDTIDEHVHDVVEQKGDIATMITDGVVNPNRKADLLKMLIGDVPKKK